MSVLKKGFVSKDGKIKIDGIIYSDKDIWLNFDELQTFFGKPNFENKDKGELKTATIEFTDKRRIQKFTIVNGEEKTVKKCVNINFLKYFNKILENQYLNEFIKWAEKFVYKEKIREVALKIYLSFVKAPSFIHLFISLLIPFLCTLCYNILNINKGTIDLSLNLLGINFALIIFNIPSIINIIKENNEKMKKLFENGEPFDNFEAKLIRKISTLLSGEILLTVLISLVTGIIILVSNVSVIWKNSLLIFALILTLWHTFHIVMQIYMEQKRSIKLNQEKDMFTNEEIEKEILNG